MLAHLLGWPGSVGVQLALLAVLAGLLRHLARPTPVIAPAGRNWRALLTGPWPATAAAALLALGNLATLLVAGHPWSVTWGFTVWGAKGALLLGWQPASVQPLRPAAGFRSAARLGLVPRLGLAPAAELTLSLLLLDYSLYRWHVLLHRLPMLWRWHRVHHADADLDVSTALRFHAAEMIWSAPWRLGQIFLIGIPPRTLALWSRLTIAEVMFHHANLRLPKRVERVLGRVLMTPRLHGIHHSNVAAHQHSNLSSGLTIWDSLSGTASNCVPQETITIGLPAEDAKR